MVQERGEVEIRRAVDCGSSNRLVEHPRRLTALHQNQDACLFCSVLSLFLRVSLSLLCSLRCGGRREYAQPQAWTSQRVPIPFDSRSPRRLPFPFSLVLPFFCVSPILIISSRRDPHLRSSYTTFSLFWSLLSTILPPDHPSSVHKRY